MLFLLLNEFQAEVDTVSTAQACRACSSRDQSFRLHMDLRLEPLPHFRRDSSTGRGLSSSHPSFYPWKYSSPNSSQVLAFIFFSNWTTAWDRCCHIIFPASDIDSNLYLIRFLLVKSYSKISPLCLHVSLQYFIRILVPWFGILLPILSIELSFEFHPQTIHSRNKSKA